MAYIEKPNQKCKVKLTTARFDDEMRVVQSLEFDDFKEYIFSGQFVIFRKFDGTERIIRADLIEDIYVYCEEDKDENE